MEAINNVWRTYTLVVCMFQVPPKVPQDGRPLLMLR